MTTYSKHKWLVPSELGSYRCQY